MKYLRFLFILFIVTPLYAGEVWIDGETDFLNALSDVTITSVADNEILA